MADYRTAEQHTEIGQRNGLDAQILAGLEESEYVITHPDDSIEDGVEVFRR